MYLTIWLSFQQSYWVIIRTKELLWPIRYITFTNPWWHVFLWGLPFPFHFYHSNLTQGSVLQCKELLEQLMVVLSVLWLSILLYMIVGSHCVHLYHAYIMDYLCFCTSVHLHGQSFCYVGWLWSCQYNLALADHLVPCFTNTIGEGNNTTNLVRSEVW